MASGDGHTVLSVRGEARRIVAPDQASFFSTVTEAADSKEFATAAAAATLGQLLGELADLGGRVLTAPAARAPVTWSTQSLHTHEEYDYHKPSGEHGPTGRHLASVDVIVNVRDFAQLEAVATVLTGHDRIDVHSVSWSVDEDNAEWAGVRADAIHAALLKGQDYASALRGRVVGVEHVADAGLLGGQHSERRMYDASTVSATIGGHESGALSLDPVPQVLSATIEARLSAVVSPLTEP